jgi:hypothetical protein
MDLTNISEATEWFEVLQTSTNKARKPAVTFNVYAPPEYPVDTKG